MICFPPISHLLFDLERVYIDLFYNTANSTAFLQLTWAGKLDFIRIEWVAFV